MFTCIIHTVFNSRLPPSSRHPTRLVFRELALNVAPRGARCIGLLTARLANISVILWVVFFAQRVSSCRTVQKRPWGSTRRRTRNTRKSTRSTSQSKSGKRTMNETSMYPAAQKMKPKPLFIPASRSPQNQGLQQSDPRDHQKPLLALRVR